MGSDWANNLIYASSSAYKLTPRFKTAQKMVNGASNKYKNYQFESIGHSQASVWRSGPEPNFSNENSS
jgi:hypothetical protein